VLIASAVLREVETLLGRGQSQRTISARLRVSRGVVSRVATGRLTSADREEYERSIADRPRPETTIPATRCPNCGGICTEAPCRRCYTEATKSPKQPSLEEPILRLVLRPDDQARYEQIRTLRSASDKEPDRAA
jgi:hypothetical protein